MKKSPKKIKPVKYSVCVCVCENGFYFGYTIYLKKKCIKLSQIQY